MKTYSELMKLTSFEDRFKYLMLDGVIGEMTFGSMRELNQIFYSSDFWKKEVRPRIIMRDGGFDLGHPDYPIKGPIYVHHLNPITARDIIERAPCLSDPENLICCSMPTHSAITYANPNLIPKKYEERKPGDTCPWRTINQGE